MVIIMENRIEKGRFAPLQYGVITINSAVEEMDAILKYAQHLPIEFQIDVQIACEALLELATTTLNKLPLPKNLLEISIQDMLIDRVLVMGDDLYPPVTLLE